MTGLDGLADGEYTAVIDTIEDGFATVFFEQDGDEVESTVIDAEILPADARHADAILSIEVSNGEISRTDYQPDLTEIRKQNSQDRFDRLSSRLPSGDDTT